MPYHQWTPSLALHPLLSTLLAILYTLSILACPPHQRGLAFAILCAPTYYAFAYHQQLTPWFALNDTFSRMLYIWSAYVSYAFLIVRVKPVEAQGEETQGGWRRRVRWAGKVLYTRRLARYYPQQCPSKTEAKRTNLGYEEHNPEPPHHLPRLQFFLHHGVRALLFLSFNCAWDAYVDTPSSHSATVFEPARASFLRRLPASLNKDELRTRALMTWNTCVADMLYFSAIYSIFALLWVCVLRLDAPHEWSLSLFGRLSDCWSVRRYWGVYWHDYIYASFSAHAKLVTRRLIKWTTPCAARRVVENAMVFGVSGLMHSLVRYVQTEGTGEVWTVALWYTAQILPIVVEDVMQHLWGKSTMRNRVRSWLGQDVLVKFERTVGYSWVFSWMFWSVPKYLLTRHAWQTEKMRQK